MFAVGAGIIALTHVLRRTDSAGRREDWTKYSIYLVIMAGILGAGYKGRLFLAVILFVVAIGGATELYRNLRGITEYALSLALISGIVLFFCLLHLLVANEKSWYAGFTFLFLLVGMTDSFSQLWGKLLGRHKCCPHLSPAKTWEGLVGGFISTSLAAISLGFLMPVQSIASLIILGVIVAAAATAGDLLFSSIKRLIGIKDFSGLIPGHGGILDRFDSLIIAAPVFYWIQKLFIY